MYKSRKIILSCLMVTAMLTFTAAAAKEISSNNISAMKNPFFADAVVSSQNKADDSDGYCLSVSDGYVAVFYNNEVIYRSKIAVNDLRSVDKSMLEIGIKVESYEEILRMLEDFGS